VADRTETIPGELPHVLFVIGSLEPGGSEGQLVTLIERSHGKRIQASLAVQSHATDVRYASVIERLELPFIVLSSPGGRLVSAAESVRGMARLLRTTRPQLVYTWLEESTLLATPVARFMQVPVMVARRNISGPYAMRSKQVVRAIYAAERLAVLTTANSNAVAAESVRRGIPRHRIRVIPNGHVAPHYEPLPSNDIVTLGYLARMRAEKGHRRLIRALTALETDVPWRLMLAGDGPLKAEIESEVARSKLQDHVHFLGTVSDVTQFWRDCDAAVLFSDHEGSPNALIEAAALGRPLVATAVGGIPEFVDDASGLLVSPTDDAAATLALRRIIEDGELRKRLGLAAQERIAARFSMDAFVEGHCAAIDEAVALSRR
jgi:glycosyltransferase involved in cell wall biosynthesis